MIKDEIIRMAIKCQLVTAGNREGLYMDALTEFAALVAIAEREECAELAAWLLKMPTNDISAAIRARGHS
jgi:hypothetical protein